MTVQQLIQALQAQCEAMGMATDLVEVQVTDGDVAVQPALHAPGEEFPGLLMIDMTHEDAVVVE